MLIFSGIWLVAFVAFCTSDYLNALTVSAWLLALLIGNVIVGLCTMNLRDPPYVEERWR